MINLNQYAADLLAQAYRGHMPKPNFNNPVTRKRLYLKRMMEKRREVDNYDPDAENLQVIKDNIGQIQKYIVSKGETPKQNPVEAATQAYLLKQNEIHQFAKLLNTDPETAQVYLDESEAMEQGINSANADYFLGALVDVIGQAVNKPLQKLADKRTAKGKKPGFVGFLAKVTTPGANVQDLQQQGTAAVGKVVDEVEKGKDGKSGFFADLKELGKSIIGGVKDKEKKEEIKKMLPTIIIIGVSVIVLTILITAYATRRK